MGTWHKSNYSTIHKKKCFSVSYSSNEIGARDSSFKDIKILDNNIFLIGDSFAEGYGVNIENTAQYFKLGMTLAELTPSERQLVNELLKKSLSPKSDN